MWEPLAFRPSSSSAPLGGRPTVVAGDFDVVETDLFHFGEGAFEVVGEVIAHRVKLKGKSHSVPNYGPVASPDVDSVGGELAPFSGVHSFVRR